MAYQVISGATAGTYLFLAPLTSLKSLDDGIARTPIHAESSKAAVENEIGRVHLLFRVEPAMSYVSDDFASADVDFWRGNTPVTRDRRAELGEKGLDKQIAFMKGPVLGSQVDISSSPAR
jgi:hypothetical protein